MEKKGFLDISFGWIFALIIGVFILFLAIFLSVKIIKIGGSQQGAEISKDIGIILDPLETGFEEGKTTILDLGIESKITNICEEDEEFGRQAIKTSQAVFGKQEGGDVEAESYNKYIFSENVLEGKTFYIFSKKFEFPFKVADLIFILPLEKNYCFIRAPEELTNTTRDLRLDNIIKADSSNDCPETSEKVCFDLRVSGCDTKVNLVLNYTEKNNKRLYFYEDSLMYATIFSSPEIYECQLKRLMKRVQSLAIIYEQKKSFVALKNCNSAIDFGLLISQTGSFNKTIDILAIANIKEGLESRNKFSQCSIW